ncbi:Exosome complex component rrp4 [Malassezia cuniculi]|uniref:Exosome complex component rrp4 n=1 Tax=Malassezia cuniculi TaxID=948313 RepID=A0AAF0ESK7_9BASI|nr:Exosome complex component rrp4 [Malassezia cuniculi]
MANAFTLVARSKPQTYVSGGTEHAADVAAAYNFTELRTGDDEPEGIVMPGQTVASNRIFMKGHGGYVDSTRANIVSTLAGTVERVNKLILVHPIRNRYRAEIGDLVVGRIVEVQAKRWRVNIGANTEANLQLSSINLPGGVQRKKLESDELQMRAFFQEGDLLVAEVQAKFMDGTVALHTRSLRYGKLRNGMLVNIPPALMRRMRTHFVSLPGEVVDMIAGMNGYIWICKHEPFDQDKAEAMHGATMESQYSSVNDPMSPATRRAITRVAFIVDALARHGYLVTDTAVANGMTILDTLAPTTLDPTAELARRLVESL